MGRKQVQGVKTTLICGFLGAGKTTFIRNQLHGNRRRTVVLVNEFGSLALDGAVMQEIDGLQVVEMAGGCICCSQKLQLADEITSIVHRLQPQRLLLEPSGVAEASEIIDILTGLVNNKMIRLEGVVTIVDAETFTEYSEPDAFGSFFLNQLSNADMVLINKEDLVPPDHLQLIIGRIKALNGGALIIPTSYGRLSVQLSDGFNYRDRPIYPSGGQPLPWQYVCLKPAARFSEQKLGQIMDLMKQGVFGRILRAKGIVQMMEDKAGKCLHLQLVGNRWTIEAQQKVISPRLTCIGFNLDRNRLESCFSSADFSTALPKLISDTH